MTTVLLSSTLRRELQATGNTVHNEGCEYEKRHIGVVLCMVLEIYERFVYGDAR